MLPLFKSHYSIGKSILTLNPPNTSSDASADSIFDILIDNSLDKLVLVEDAPTGFLQARKNCLDQNIHLIFGLRFKISCESKDAPKSIHKVIIFAKNDDGCKDLNLIYSSIYCDLDGLGNFECLKKLWNGKNLMLAIPFYDSFLYQNSFSFSNCIPDFSFADPLFFLENNNLPVDFMLTDIVNNFCEEYGYKKQSTKSIFYKNRADSDALQTYKCICNRDFSRNTSLSRPNLEGFGSREFCFESWKEVAV
jgi:DNA polymerase III alpha subunit